MKETFEREINLASLAEIDRDDWDDISDGRACLLLPDGSRWVRNHEAEQEHRDQITAVIFRRKNQISMRDAQKEEELPGKVGYDKPIRDWRLDDYHDVFTRTDMDDSPRYCSVCGWFDSRVDMIPPR